MQAARDAASEPASTNPTPPTSPTAHAAATTPRISMPGPPPETPGYREPDDVITPEDVALTEAAAAGEAGCSTGAPPPNVLALAARMRAGLAVKDRSYHLKAFSECVRCSACPPPPQLPTERCR